MIPPFFLLILGIHNVNQALLWVALLLLLLHACGAPVPLWIPVFLITLALLIP